MFSCRDSVEAGADAQDFALIGFEDFEAKAVGVDDFAGARNVSCEAIQQSRDGGGGRVLHGGVEFHTKQLADFVHRDAAPNDEGAAGFANDVGRRAAVFFADFADNFFHHVFDGDDPGHQTVFVNHDGHLLILALHFLQQFGAKLRLRHKKSGALQFTNGAMRGFGVRHFEHIARHSSSDASVRIAMTSGRGVITSRTRLSPNSTTCSMSRASSCSMIPSSVAASTKSSMACCSAAGALCSSSET